MKEETKIFLKRVGLFLFIFVLIYVSLLLYFYIFRPAYYSYEFVCNPNGPEIIESKGYTPAGQTMQTVNGSNTTIKISFSENLTLDKSIVKHECVHYIQYLKGLPGGECHPFIYKYMSEIEAYSGELLPDSIYNIVYGDIGRKCVEESIKNNGLVFGE